MQINRFPRQELRHPTSRLAVMAAGVNSQVCASDPCDGADIHADLCFSFHQLWAPVTQGKGSSKQKRLRVCVHTIIVSLSFTVRQLRRKPTRRHRSLGAQQATQESSDLSKSPWGTSPHFVPITRFAYDPCSQPSSHCKIFRKLPPWGTRSQTSSHA